MEMKERKSGLVVPAEKPTPPPREYGPLEITDKAGRNWARDAMLLLWDAMDLSSGGGGIRLPGKPTAEVHRIYYSLYRLMGEALLGDECPEREQLT